MDLHCRNLLLLMVILYISRYSYQLQNGSRYVTNCPRTTSSRKQQSGKLNCTWGSLVNMYLCLPTIEGRLIEFCSVDISLPSKDGCPYLAEVNGRIQIQQKACKGNKYGCPEAIKAEKFLLSDAHMFPSCLPISVETTKTKVSSTKISTNYNFVEVNDSRTTQTRFDSGTTNGNTATVGGLLWTKSVFVFGVGLFVLISVFTGYVAFPLYKRRTDLRERLEADHCMSSNSYRGSTTQRYDESENEGVYDEDETSMSNSEKNLC